MLITKYQTFSRIFSQTNIGNFKLKIFDNATHGLLKSNHFNVLDPGVVFLLKFKLFGRRVFVKDVLSDISDFIITSSS